MKTTITIGQLAKLMKVSTHQIRYFEEKGVLLPKFIDENGYRMYGMNEVYHLAHIMLMRELDIPVGKIKKLFDEGGKEDYIAEMKQSIRTIDDQIKALKEIKKKTNILLDYANEMDNRVGKYRVEEKEHRKLLEIERFPFDYIPTALDYYEHLEQTDVEQYDEDVYQLYDDDHCYICIEKKNQGDHLLNKGSYLCYDTVIADADEMDTIMSEYFDYAIKNNLNLIGKLIIIEDAYLSIFDNKKLYIRIEMKLK